MSRSSFHVARIRMLVVLALLLTPMAVRTTSYPPPYIEFNVSGTIVRSGGGSPENYTIGVAAHRGTENDWWLLWDGNRPLDISSETGSFYVSARVFEHEIDPLDSLAVAIVLPGEEPAIAEVFAVDSDTPHEVSGWFTPVTQSDGCCEDNPVAVKRVEGYVYSYDGKTITIP